MLLIVVIGVKMLGFFLDAELTRPITLSSPKRFLAPTTGYTKYGTIYLGDPYSAALLDAAGPGATSLVLSDVNEFLPSGSALVGSQTVTYTGISGLSLTGVSGLSSPAALGTKVVPLVQWDSSSNINIYPFGLDAASLSISLRLNGAPSFNPIGAPLVLSQAYVAIGEVIPIDVQITVAPGLPKEFTNWQLNAGPFYKEQLGSSSITSSVGLTVVMYGYVNQYDQALPTPIRILPLNRKVVSSPPGFVIGEYSWRDDTEINEQTIVPTNWLTDPTTLGNQMFVPGIGGRTDLEPLGFTQANDSIYLQINRGFYFTGPKGYYLPATPEIDFISAQDLTFSPTNIPQSTLPVFVGNYVLDSQGFYEWNIVYKYETTAGIAIRTANGTLPEYYYTWNPVSKLFTLNTVLPDVSVSLGQVSGSPIDYFDIPIYPVNTIQDIYVLKPDGSHLPIVYYSYDANLGTIKLYNPAGTGVSVPGSVQGEQIIAVCSPAVAIIFDTQSNPVRILDTIDLNPAFAGISGGYVYLQHSRQEVAGLVLSCDKPLISIPATFSSIIGLVAYGPVYFNGDYALLQVTAFSEVPGQTVQGAELEVIVDPSTFTGTLNYIDPTLETLTVTTGADGIANLVFRPSASFYGYWIPTVPASGVLAGLATTTLTNDTVVLPAPVPINQLYLTGALQPWQVSLYEVLNNSRQLGMVGADTSIGEVPWATSGVLGTTNYKTNGEMEILINSTSILYPIKALDSTGKNFTDTGFSGNVVSLVYGQSIPTDPTIGAYFVTFIQNTLLKMKVAGNSSVESNYILLQMSLSLPPAPPQLFLILNDLTQGILGQYRLGINI